MQGLALAAAIIFFILLAHFRKVSIALLMFASLLLCLFGTATGVLIQGVDFGVTCVLGIIALMGIIVRNGIIMFDYAEELRTTEHMTAEQAIYHFRPATYAPHLPHLGSRFDGRHPDDTRRLRTVDADGYGHLLRHTHHDGVPAHSPALRLPAHLPRLHAPTGKMGRIGTRIIHP